MIWTKNRRENEAKIWTFLKFNKKLETFYTEMLKHGHFDFGAVLRVQVWLVKLLIMLCLVAGLALASLHDDVLSSPTESGAIRIHVGSDEDTEAADFVAWIADADTCAQRHYTQTTFDPLDVIKMMRECAAELGVSEAMAEGINVQRKLGEDGEAFKKRAWELETRATKILYAFEAFLYHFDMSMEGGYENWKMTQGLIDKAIRDQESEYKRIVQSNKDLKKHTSHSVTNHFRKKVNSLLHLSQIAKDMKDMKKVEAGGTVGVSGTDPTSWRARAARNFRYFKHKVGLKKDDDAESTNRIRENVAFFKIFFLINHLGEHFTGRRLIGT